MVVSMTGFGRSKKEHENFKVIVEMKSVNHRFCEITVRMPRQFLLFEDKLKKTVNQYIGRGRVDVFVTVEGEGYINRTLQVDWNLLSQYEQAVEKAKHSYKLDGSFSVEQLLNLPEVFTVNENEDGIEVLEQVLLEVTKEAAIELQNMRKIEGKALKADIVARLELIDLAVQYLIPLSADVVEKYRERLTKKMNDFLNGVYEVDEGRILTEVAIFADKADINEELTRLHSHIGQFYKIIEANESIGRKLDFLVQEMNREMNTIGSKANDVQISQKVVEMKSELEKIKEQVQNIE
ncbi:YicC/YloC family endoribonuclease [Calidifontibacillus oryziterrae]|uniref:YicC/YloC family endoribonuclease n=1 Tax=Calidifontibacillus oryziterrae TaxID=1191699 RepID=UPI0002DC15F9|nr:YicC/YloC family endoribonuclease [Calidifontibacillus oryziterrae]